MTLDRHFAGRALITHVSREDQLKVSSGQTVWNVVIAVFLMGLVFFATLFNLIPPRRTIGLALSYTLLSMAPPLVLSLIEHLTRPAGPRKSAKSWLLHFQIQLANYASRIPFGILAVYLASVLANFLGLNLGIIDLRFADEKGLASLIGAFLIVLLIGDFFFYWYHRSLHKSRILWQHHKLHHMDPEFDAMTGGRQSWLESFFSVFFISVPMAVLFKFNALDPLDAGLINGAIIGFFQSIVFINHSNLRLQFGRASVVFISSQTHRIHHSFLPQHCDKNFVAFFPIWDILFGTYYHPARDEFPPTGVEGEKEIESVWEAQIFALREWWKMYRARHGKKPTAIA